MITPKDSQGHSIATGNVIENAYGHLYIVTKIRGDGYVDMVSFSAERVSGGMKPETYFSDEICYSHGGGGVQCRDPECEDCEGSGTMKVERPGADQCTILAKHVKQYIMDRLTKDFEFKVHT